MKSYVVKRAVYTLVVLYLVMTFNFFLFNLMPGNPLMQYIGSAKGEMSDERWGRLREYYKLDRPLHERYASYIVNMLRFDFGISQMERGSVAEVAAGKLTLTLQLIGGATIISIIVGILLGMVAAVKRGSTADTGLVTGSLITYSVPIFWLAWLFLMLFAIQLRWFPTDGAWPKSWAGIGNWPTNPLEYLWGRLYHMALPMMTLVLFTVGGWILLARSCILECITEDYVTTARAKGLNERTVLLKHVLKNASLPLITSVAISFGFVITGAIITETVFNYEGMGAWIWHAIQGKDLPVMQAVFYLVALCVLLANFLADMIYGVIDPRIRYG